MIVFWLIAFVLFITSTSVASKKDANELFAYKQTLPLKGLFVLVIFFHYFNSYTDYVAWFDQSIETSCRFLGQLMVAPFLFFSGYGIFESLKKKGDSYIKNFPKKRILKTLIHFDIAVLIYLLYALLTGTELSLSKTLLAFIAWTSIGNSNWFIFAILYSYIITFLSVSVFKSNQKKSLIAITIFTLLYISILFFIKRGWWFDTILAFPIGIFCSIHKEKIHSILRIKWIYACLLLVGIFIWGFSKTDTISSIFINSQLALVAFLLLMILAILKLNFNGKILSWLGVNVFGVYIFQRLPMNFGKLIHLDEFNLYLYFVFCFLATLTITILFNKIFKLLDKFLNLN